MSPLRTITPALAAATLLVACGQEPTSAILPGADAQRGAQLIERFGCGSCHTIDGIEGADADVGPNLTDFADDRYIVGSIPKTPRNVMAWIRAPRRFEPDTIMPDLGVTEAQARDIVQYLYGQ